jgi:uroporphyrinogen-III synthase
VKSDGAPQPLLGRRIVLTRAIERSTDYEAALRGAGATVECASAIRFDRAAGESEASLKSRLDRLARLGGWLILSSPTACREFLAAAGRIGFDLAAMHSIRVAVVGAASRRVLLEAKAPCDFVSPLPTGLTLAVELPIEPRDRAALIAGAREGRPELPEELRAMGLDAVEHALYATTPDRKGLNDLQAMLESASPPDALALFSPSAVAAIDDAIGARARPALVRCAWVAIGPTTASEIARRGLPPPEVAESPSATALVRATIRCWAADSAKPSDPARS